MEQPAWREHADWGVSIRRFELTRLGLGAHLFEVPFDSSETGVEDLLDPQEFFVEELFKRAQVLLHFAESPVHLDEALVHFDKPLVDFRKPHVDVRAKVAQPRVIDEDTYEYGDRRHGNAQDDPETFHVLTIAGVAEGWET